MKNDKKYKKNQKIVYWWKPHVGEQHQKYKHKHSTHKQYTKYKVKNWQSEQSKNYKENKIQWLK